MATVPIALFAYARPDHLRQTLASLRADQVPLIYAFSDGPRSPEHADAVAKVRAALREVDWCKLVLTERAQNMGLGRSIRSGVAEVLARHDRLIVVEDDLICVPGTYAYLCAALERYRDAPEVMSVTGWTHPRVTPHDVGARPYFDGRAECWIWGTWSRSWQGMEQDAVTLMRRCRAEGIDPYAYGADLPAMAHDELRRNIWAVRWLYLHMLRRGLCLRPPWSMVEHIGFDAQATNAQGAEAWRNPPLADAPPLPEPWPAPAEHPDCQRLWRQANGGAPPPLQRLASSARRAAGATLRGLGLRK